MLKGAQASPLQRGRNVQLQCFSYLSQLHNETFKQTKLICWLNKLQLEHSNVMAGQTSQAGCGDWWGNTHTHTRACTSAKPLQSRLYLRHLTIA